jgi:hypothetical protein
VNVRPVVVVGIVALSTAACAHGVKVTPAVRQTNDVSRYVTFFMLDGSSSGNPDVDRQIKTALRTALADKAVVETSPEEAEAAVIAHVATPARHSREAFYRGWGGWRWRADNAGATTIDDYGMGTLVVDIFDARTRQLVWQATAAHAVPGDASSHPHTTREAVVRMFKAFPWPSAGSAAPHDRAGNLAVSANDPSMRVIFSPVPAVLIRIDGDPVYGDVGGTGLQRILNTRALIARDETGTYFLRIGGAWMKADELSGPWSIAGTLADDAAAALGQAVPANDVDPLDDALAAHPEPGPVRSVYVSTVAAALVVTDGDPKFGPVEGTPLLYVTNTTDCVLRDSTDQELYVLVSGRWFRSWTMNGQWQRVPDDELPADLSSTNDVAGHRQVLAGSPCLTPHRARPRGGDLPLGGL